MKNYAISVLEKREKFLEWSVEKYDWPWEIMQLHQIRQAIVDLKEKEAQREMAKEAEDGD